jgi:hypothetical protein
MTFRSKNLSNVPSTNMFEGFDGSAREDQIPRLQEARPDRPTEGDMFDPFVALPDPESVPSVQLEAALRNNQAWEDFTRSHPLGIESEIVARVVKIDTPQ